MAQFDFDRIIDRSHTGAMKWDARKENGMGEDVLAMWVADMDFEAPPAVKEAIVAKAQSGVYGYDIPAAGFRRAVKEWMGKRHDWEIEEDWIVISPGVVFAFSAAICTLTQPGDAVLLQSPVYGPFFSAIQRNGRKLVDNPLLLKDGRYEVDFQDMEKKIVEQDVKLFMFCSPHNPTGRVWTHEELSQLAAICQKHGVMVVSDEIHHDLVFAPHKHLPFAALSPWAAENTITCTAPSKTFNLAGLDHANTIIENAPLRDRYVARLEALGYSSHASFGALACREAYSHGGEWLEALLAYVRGNFDLLRDRLDAEMPCIHLIEPEGLYLAWLDMRELSFSEENASLFLQKKAKLWCNDGASFGTQGAGFVRMNLACPRSVVAEALNRIAQAYKNASHSSE